MIPGIDGMLNVAGKVMDRVWPDPATKQKAMLELEKLRQDGDLSFLNADVKLLSGQLEINKLEAQHGGNFKGGWRPAIGWVCALALAYSFLIQPFLLMAVNLVAWAFNVELFPIHYLPVLDMPQLMSIMGGMLGLGGLRTYEKRKSEQQLREGKN